MCSNPRQLLRNLRLFGITAKENPGHRLGILFCTRPVYKFVRIAFCTKICGQELAELGHPLPILGMELGVGEGEERELLLHHALARSERVAPPFNATVV